MSAPRRALHYALDGARKCDSDKDRTALSRHAWGIYHACTARETHGRTPCIPPMVLAVIAERAASALAAKVSTDEATEPEIH